MRIFGQGLVRFSAGTLGKKKNKKNSSVIFVKIFSSQEGGEKMAGSIEPLSHITTRFFQTQGRSGRRRLRWKRGNRARQSLPSADRNNKATLLLTGLRRTTKSSAKDLSRRWLLLQYVSRRTTILARPPMLTCWDTRPKPILVRVRGGCRRFLARILA